MSTKKIIIVGGIAVFALLGLGFFGLVSATEKIANSRDCESFTVDHTEVRAKVNIPPVLDADCNYNAAEKRKTTVFMLNKQVFDIVEYSQMHDFRKTDSIPANFREFDADGISALENPELFLREGKTQTNSYSMLLDTQSGKLWVDLRYFYDQDPI